MATIFAVPGSTYLQSKHDGGREHRAAKRKRKTSEIAVHNPIEDSDIRDDDSLTDEYTAVISPEERSQRRLAGQPLSLDPPPHPFPHSKATSKGQSTTGDKGDGKKRPGSGSHSSLHLQHLSCLSAILHQSIVKRDYKRTARALGLILREEISGHPVDIRAAGYWSIAAETLLHLPSQAFVAPDNIQVQSDSIPAQPESLPTSILTRQGFEAAKKYYEAMIIQYPYHKTWPESVNIIDFYLAMFNIWIYVVDEESKYTIVENQAANQEILTKNYHEHQAKLRELSEANQIARRIDQCMTSIPMMDNVDLLNLRTMVAQWQVDLNNACEQYAENREVDVQMHDGEEEAIAVNSDVSPSDQEPGEFMPTLNYLPRAGEPHESVTRLPGRNEAVSPG